MSKPRSGWLNGRLNDEDRSQWIDNDEGLYNWWKSECVSKRKFLRANREEIDKVIDNVRNRKPAHYLKYGG